MCSQSWNIEDIYLASDVPAILKYVSEDLVKIPVCVEVKAKVIKTLAIVNVVGSSIAREADNVFYTLARTRNSSGNYKGI